MDYFKDNNMEQRECVAIVARQPIFDRKKKTVAFELLYRSIPHNKNEFPKSQDGTLATLQVIQNSMLSMGVEKITGGKKGYINFTKKTILEKIPLALNPDYFVVEILEDIDAEPEIIKSIQILKERGFVIALDDFICRETNKDLINFANIIKVDVLNTPPEEIIPLTESLKKNNKILLAEKVENEEVFNKCLELGYSLFQGYFFAKPELIQSREIPVNKLSILNLLALIAEEDIEVKKMTSVIEREPSLSYKLLKIVNSAAFCLIKEIGSIKQAIMILGEKEIKRWITIIALANISDDKPQELVITSCIRARFCEKVAALVDPSLKECAFLTGLFSLFDVMLGRPLNEIITHIPLSQTVKEALIEEKGLLSDILHLVKAYEQMDVIGVAKLSDTVGLDRQDLFEVYTAASDWANTVYNIN